MPVSGLSSFLNLTPIPPNNLTEGMQVTADKNLSGANAGDAINIAVNFLPGSQQGTQADVIANGAGL